jgi:hypothetical protein
MQKEWNSAAKIAQLVEDALNAFTKENVASGVSPGLVERNV